MTNKPIHDRTNSKIRRIKASTLAETLVALVIITTVFGIALMLITNLYKNPADLSKRRAVSLIDQFSAESKISWNDKNTSQTESSLRIERKVEQYDNQPDLFLQNWRAYDETGRMVYEKNELVYVRTLK